MQDALVEPQSVATLRVGTAGWGLPRAYAERFPGDGTHLARYAAQLHAVEINSSFYRPHRPATYARWAATVPAGFRFAVKLPKSVTHDRRLVGCDDVLGRFLGEAEALGPALGPLLAQLPPSLPFDPAAAGAFFAAFAGRATGGIVCEPRHASWFTPEADRFLADHRVARVAADPALAPGGGEPGGWSGLVYHRLHGAPRVYVSDYGPEVLAAIAQRLARSVAQGVPAWCIFDNTTLGHALGNALAVAGAVS